MTTTYRGVASVALAVATCVAACGQAGSAEQRQGSRLPTPAPAAATSPTAPAKKKSYVAKASGKGVLLTVPLLYRLREADVTEDRAYYAIFRVRSRFVGYDRDGNSMEGQVFFSGDNEEKGLTSLSPGYPRGRCYEWDLPKDNAIDQMPIGDSVPFKFKLNATSTQTGRTILRQADPEDALTAELDKQVKSIGCRILYRKNFAK